MTDLAADVDAIQRIGAVPKILDAAGRITGMGFVAIARVTSERWVCCAVRDTINFGLDKGGELQVETTICNEIRQHGQVVTINDVVVDGAFCNHPTPRMYGFRSYISVPIRLADGMIWGTLCAIDPEPHEVSRPEIVDTFQLFGELIATQLELQQRFDQAQESLRVSQADLLDARRSSELREQFIGVLGHDLRNPLASIDAGMRVMLRNLHPERTPDIIAMIQKSVMRMTGIVDNLMDFARGRLGGGNTLKRDSAQPLTPVLEQVISEIRLAWPEATIAATIDIEEPVNCDRSKIGQLFSNLLGNAITHGDPGQPIRVSAKTDQNSFALSVTNFGTPISDRVMQNLFKPFIRGDRPSQQGLGLGLYIASQIAEAHGGKLDAVSTAEGTTFDFRMPRRS